MIVLSKIHTVEYFKEIPFYKQLSVTKLNQAFQGCVMSCKVDLIEKKDLIVQLEPSKSSIKYLLSDLLSETKGLKYQIITSSMKKLNLL